MGHCKKKLYKNDWYGRSNIMLLETTNLNRKWGLLEVALITVVAEIVGASATIIANTISVPQKNVAFDTEGLLRFDNIVKSHDLPEI